VRAAWEDLIVVLVDESLQVGQWPTRH